MNKVTFRCKRSGNTVSFTDENDIAGLRKHEEYTEVLDAETIKTVQIKPPETPVKEVLKLRRKPQTSQGIPDFLQD